MVWKLYSSIDFSTANILLLFLMSSYSILNSRFEPPLYSNFFLFSQYSIFRLRLISSAIPLNFSELLYWKRISIFLRFEKNISFKSRQSRILPTVYHSYSYIFTSYFDNISRKTKYLFVILFGTGRGQDRPSK